MTHIHFICTGNIYRSRLAEAYLRSKQLPNLIISSSGTRASAQHKGTITWYALRLMNRYNLLQYMNPDWTDTTEKHITQADTVIFIGKNNYEYCKKMFPIPIKCEVWDLPDFDDVHLNGKPLNMVAEIKYLETSENVFFLIRTKIDNLIKERHLQSKYK